MGAITKLIDGAVEVTTAGGELAAEKLRAGAALIGLILVLLFLLIMFAVEPITATILAVVIVLAAAYVLTSSDSEII